jgi:hypothetical protein
MVLGLLGALTLTEKVNGSGGYSANYGESICVSRDYIEEMSQRLGVSSPFSADATGVCFHFAFSGSLGDRSTASVPDSSDDRTPGPLEDHGHVRSDHHAPDSPKDPPVSGVTLVPVEVMDEDLVADRQPKMAPQ